MDQTKTLYIANYLELNNKGILPVCKEGCNQLLGVSYNCNAHGNLKNCINTLYDILTDGVVTPDGVVTSDLSASAQIWTPTVPYDKDVTITELLEMYNLSDKADSNKKSYISVVKTYTININKSLSFSNWIIKLHNIMDKCNINSDNPIYLSHINCAFHSILKYLNSFHTSDLSTSLPDDQVIIIAEYNVDDSTQHKDITISEIVKSNDWIIRVGDGKNFKNSSKYGIWGIKSRCAKFFLRKVNFGDRLWFVTSKSHGQLIGLSTYCSHNYREFGPLLNVSMTDDELGWTGGDNTWDIEIHYTDLYDLENRILLTHIKSPMVIREYNNKCKINLPAEYNMTKLD